MDNTDKKILDLIKGNARMSFQEIGDAIGMSRVAAKKRIDKLERDGVIRGYNTCIYREDETMMFMDIVTSSGGFERVMDFLTTQTADIRQIYRTSKKNHIHVVAVSEDISNLEYQIKMIRKKCRDDVEDIDVYTAQEIIKDVYGGLNHEQRSVSDDY